MCPPIERLKRPCQRASSPPIPPPVRSGPEPQLLEGLRCPALRSVTLSLEETGLQDAWADCLAALHTLERVEDLTLLLGPRRAAARGGGALSESPVKVESEVYPPRQPHQAMGSYQPRNSTPGNAQRQESDPAHTLPLTMPIMPFMPITQRSLCARPAPHQRYFSSPLELFFYLWAWQSLLSIFKKNHQI